MAGFGGAVKLTGESEYKKALKDITQNLKEVTSELKLVTAQYAEGLVIGADLVGVPAAVAQHRHGASDGITALAAAQHRQLHADHRWSHC